MIDLKSMEIPDYNPNKLENPQPSQSQFNPSNWPTVFSKPVIGMERKNVVTKNGSLDILPGALEAIRSMRLKGYKLVLITDETGGDQATIEGWNTRLMQIFGESGIFSIDSYYYSTGTDKGDIYRKPATGMFRRAEAENPGINFKKGWYVGHTVLDAKTSFKTGAKPILINPSKEEIKKLNSFANKKIKKKTRIFESLLDFEKTLK